jgi:hypothetical protein
LNLWTPIPNAKVLIGGQDWTAQATNVTDGLPIYLDFSEPIVGTAAELQSLLNVSHGTLSPRARKSRGNRRFAFSVITRLFSREQFLWLFAMHHLVCLADNKFLFEKISERSNVFSVAVVVEQHRKFRCCDGNAAREFDS